MRRLSTFGYWADWFQARFDGEPLDLAIVEKSVNLDGEIETQGPRAINRYLAGLAAGKREEKIKRVRAIFIGNGDAGKTSLIRALNDEPAAGDTDMTCGIEISEWQVGNTGLTAHFWDFGGQVIAHATHQFFLRARCVYVLVLNARSADSNPNQQAEYWLEFARAFGADAPVLLVGNKCDQTPVAVDLNRLRESYPNIRGFHGLSATEYRGKYAREFGIFKDAFIDELTRIEEDARLYFSREEFNLIKALRAQSRQAAFLEKRAFDELCAARGIEEGERRDELLSLLDKLGEVIHFPELYRAGFKEFLLNPRWLTQGVYRLLYSDTLRNAEGILRWNDVRGILRNETIKDERGNRLDYPEEKLNFLVRAMAEFKLCYPAPEKTDQWIVPDLLPSDQPADIGFDRQEALRFDFRFDTFLPRHVLGMFIVAQYRDIQDNLAWQHGVCLASRRWNTRALIRADYQSRVLKLEIAGDHVDSYFAILYESILEILERMPRLRHTQRLHLIEAARIGGGRAFSHKEPVDEEPTADFGSLLVHKAEGRQEFLCEFGKYDLQMLLHPMQSKTGGDRPEPKTERRAMTFWRERLGDLGSLVSLLSLFR
uniref:non-specific serine/threonine protein kinase n=1 Tax=Candidatus Kentrum sp. UNK TaxID=2126344 RepID=A0A451AYT9_9GAMM|nr:MAG: Ras of Complex, Roc, domain of DAPkinase [Candidatus Kentron sp. UNK]VFK71206.1 MAG: Ras of Complex, Roc, domain of DAPkinase [Candidatus Kentron sp. UNK]